MDLSKDWMSWTSWATVTLKQAEPSFAQFYASPNQTSTQLHHYLYSQEVRQVQLHQNHQTGPQPGGEAAEWTVL